MMQRKPGYPLASCSIKMPDSLPMSEPQHEGEMEQQQRRQQLINYGHALWGFNNWSWSVTKQDLDFVDFASGKFSAGVVAFVSVVVKSSDIHRENVGYATALATTKGAAIHQSRKCAVTNALRETLLSFGGSVATDLMELLDTNKPEHVPSEPLPENNQNLPNRAECKNMRKNSTESPRPLQPPQQIKNVMPTVPTPIATAAPMPVNLPPAANRPPQPRPPHVSVVLPLAPQMYPPPRPAPPYPPYYEYPWHFYDGYERPGNVNLNFNLPPKNLVVNRAGMDCQNACGIRRGPSEGEPIQYGQNRGCWIKPTIFYDGFWTEQKVRRWVAEQVEKRFPEDISQKSASPGDPDKS